MQVRGLFPVAVLSVRQTAHPKHLWTSKGKEQNLPDKRYPGIQGFLLEFHSEENVDFPAVFSLPTKWDEANGTCPLLTQGWAIPCGNKKDWNKRIFQIPSKPNYSMIPWTNFSLSHLKAAVWTLWYHHDKDPRGFPRQWLFLMSYLHFKSRRGSTAKQSWSCQIKHQGEREEKIVQTEKPNVSITICMAVVFC